MKKIFKKFLLPALICPVMLTACTEDSLIVSPDSSDSSSELPVEFLFSCAEEGGTRAYIDAFGTERFSKDDVIHVLGTFTTNALQPDGSYKEGTMKRYGALKYNGIIWESLEDSKLTWPSIATEATFIAYYIKDSSGLLTSDQPTLVSYLSELTSSSDPLYGKSDNDEPVPYGNAAKIDFHHICAHLTLVDLEPNVSDQYWLTVPDNTLNNADPNDETTTPFYNAFQISLGKDENNEPELNFEFIQRVDPEYNLVFIKGYPTMVPPPETSPLDPATMNLEFFLSPGYYDVFNLVYPVSSTETYPYLEYNYNNIPDYVGDTDYEKVPPQLEENTPYTLNITKAPGITMTTPTTGGGWDESDQFYYVVNVEEFLKAANKGAEYSEGEKKILEETLNGSKLLCNVDFHGFDYADFEDKSFLPDIPQDKVFDGGLHYIKNIFVPVFYYNYGKIENLGIKNPEKLEMQILSYEDPAKDNSRNGALCHQNRLTGTLSNIRLSDIMMNVTVISDVVAGTDDSEVHNIGGLAGSNTGVINGVEMGGQFSINVSGVTGSPMNSKVLIGGVLGQNAGGGLLEDVSTINNHLEININNSCVGEIGSYSVGGIVGQLSGDVSGVLIPTVKIDCTGSKGVTSYIGGMAGNLATSTAGETGSINSCNVGGVIKAGESIPYGSLTSESYIGGIGGSVLNISVTECNSSVSVYGPAVANQNVIYGTGGGFGRILQSTLSYNFEKLICSGTTLQGPGIPEGYIGNFVGIAPDDSLWDAWMDNFSSHQITVKDFGYDNIGESMN
ncbi:MAG: fimbrillin family protein [Muribaculaceae bacterium]|nr:fimbrillin family protein [Muribaculaceae bacterium]